MKRFGSTFFKKLLAFALAFVMTLGAVSGALAERSAPAEAGGENAAPKQINYDPIAIDGDPADGSAAIMWLFIIRPQRRAHR